jgi:hypothetical protein
LVQFSILDSRTEARSISRKPRTDASALRRAQLSRSTFCLRYAATPPSSQTPRARGTPRLTRLRARPPSLQPRATPRRPPRMPQVCPRAPAAPPSHVSLPGAHNALDSPSVASAPCGLRPSITMPERSLVFSPRSRPLPNSSR